MPHFYSVLSVSSVVNCDFQIQSNLSACRNLSCICCVRTSIRWLNFQQRHQSRRLFCRKLLPLFAGHGQIFTVPGVRIGMRLVAVGLSCLGEKYERCGIGRLQAEGQVQKHERVKVKMSDFGNIGTDPQDDDKCLRYEKKRRAKKSDEGFSLEGD